MVTKYDDFREQESIDRFEQLKESIDGPGVSFEYEYDQTQSFHARNIETNTGWKISIDRSLDIFQPYDFKNPCNLANNIHEERLCKGFEVTYLKDINDQACSSTLPSSFLRLQRAFTPTHERKRKKHDCTNLRCIKV